MKPPWAHCLSSLKTPAQPVAIAALVSHLDRGVRANVGLPWQAGRHPISSCLAPPSLWRWGSTGVSWEAEHSVRGWKVSLEVKAFLHQWDIVFLIADNGEAVRDKSAHWGQPGFTGLQPSIKQPSGVNTTSGLTELSFQSASGHTVSDLRRRRVGAAGLGHHKAGTVQHEALVGW